MLLLRFCSPRDSTSRGFNLAASSSPLSFSKSREQEQVREAYMAKETKIMPHSLARVTIVIRLFIISVLSAERAAPKSLLRTTRLIHAYMYISRVYTFANLTKLCVHKVQKTKNKKNKGSSAARGFSYRDAEFYCIHIVCFPISMQSRGRSAKPGTARAND